MCQKSLFCLPSLYLFLLIPSSSPMFYTVFLPPADFSLSPLPPLPMSFLHPLSLPLSPLPLPFSSRLSFIICFSVISSFFFIPSFFISTSRISLIISYFLLLLSLTWMSFSLPHFYLNIPILQHFSLPFFLYVSFISFSPIPHYYSNPYFVSTTLPNPSFFFLSTYISFLPPPPPTRRPIHHPD